MPPISTSLTRKSRRRESSRRARCQCHQASLSLASAGSLNHSDRVLSLGVKPGIGIRRMDRTVEQAARAQPEIAMQQAMPLAQVSDITIALAAARVVRAIPMVADLNRGREALAVTYGLSPDQQVIGIVVHHPSPNTRRVQVHVVLVETLCTLSVPSQMAEGQSMLSDIAEQIRVAVYQAVQDIDGVVLVGVDVLIDDLR